MDTCGKNKKILKKLKQRKWGCKKIVQNKQNEV